MKSKSEKIEKKHRQNSFQDLEFFEYCIKPAFEFTGTPEDLGYKAIKTPHGTLYVRESTINSAKMEDLHGKTLLTDQKQLTGSAYNKLIDSYMKSIDKYISKLYDIRSVLYMSKRNMKGTK